MVNYPVIKRTSVLGVSFDIGCSEPQRKGYPSVVVPAVADQLGNPYLQFYIRLFSRTWIPVRVDPADLFALITPKPAHDWSDRRRREFRRDEVYCFPLDNWGIEVYETEAEELVAVVFRGPGFHSARRLQEDHDRLAGLLSQLGSGVEFSPAGHAGLLDYARHAGVIVFRQLEGQAPILYPENAGPAWSDFWRSHGWC